MHESGSESCPRVRVVERSGSKNKETGRSHPSSPSPTSRLRAREFQNWTDPMQTMWDALDRAGCAPHGDPRGFMARCPVHKGASRNLRVSEGADGQVVLFCLAHSTTCDYRAITSALGLPVSALFPPGHRRAENLKPRPVKALSAGAAFLDAMTVAGYGWHAQLLGVECPYCSDPNAYLTVHDAGGLDVNCPNSCAEREVRRAVETRAAIAEKGLEL